MHTCKGLELVQLVELCMSFLLVQGPLEELELAKQGLLSGDLLGHGRRVPREEGQELPHLGEDPPSSLDGLCRSQAPAHLAHDSLDAVHRTLRLPGRDLVHLLLLQRPEPRLALGHGHCLVLRREAQHDLLLDGGADGLVGTVLQPGQLDLEGPVEVQQDLAAALQDLGLKNMSYYQH